MSNYIYENSQKRRYMSQFEQTFKVGFDIYFNNLSGFDIVKFDEEVIKPPDGVSTSEQILKDYGPEAVALIKKLI